jgi:hypothetical protein
MLLSKQQSLDKYCSAHTEQRKRYISNTKNHYIKTLDWTTSTKYVKINRSGNGEQSITSLGNTVQNVIENTLKTVDIVKIVIRNGNKTKKKT